MYYILNDNIALRSYRLVPAAYLTKGCKIAKGLTGEELELLKECDGLTDLEPFPALDKLSKRGLIEPCEKGARTLSDWQKYRDCDNRYMPTLNLQITGKCNYNCLHCFNCKDNAPLQSEMSMEQMTRLLDECVECGVTSFTVTGGEPFVHPHFREILSEIYKRNLFIFELNSNGYFINEDILDFMNSIGCKPEIKISFDGIGCHDWLRQHKGAEEKAINAIKLCMEKGFEVRVQTNANKKNADSIYPTLCMLDELGVPEVRLIKTTDAPRWEQNAKGLDFSWEEYYDFLVELFGKFAHEDHKLAVDVWQTLYYNAEGKYYNISCLSSHGKLNPKGFICEDGRRMAAVASTGEAYQCMQMQGFMVERGLSFGNVFKDGLKAVLGESKLMDMVCLCIQDRLDKNPECSACEYLKYCQGGCPALAMLTNTYNMDSFFAPDRTKCLMLKGGYYNKFTETFGPDNENTCPME